LQVAERCTRGKGRRGERDRREINQPGRKEEPKKRGGNWEERSQSLLLRKRNPARKEKGRWGLET